MHLQSAASRPTPVSGGYDMQVRRCKLLALAVTFDDVGARHWLSEQVSLRVVAAQL